MRALVVERHGEAPRLGAFPGPAPADGRTLVAVRAASLNPVDVMIAAGRFYGDAPAPPYVPGAELVGEVLESARIPAGTRIWALCTAGGLAERALVSDEALVPVPEGLDDGLAAALGVAGLAGWMSVRTRGRLAPGETVLVLGAGGVVGQAAVQAAVLGGAGRVVAAARSEEGRRRALGLGATDAVDLTGDGLAAALAAAAGSGAHLIVDTLWGPPARAALGALRRRGRLVQVGSAAAPATEITAGPLRGGRIDILGFSLFSEERADVAAAYADAAAAALAGDLRLPVERVPLAEGPAAWARLVAGAGGVKLVVVP